MEATFIILGVLALGIGFLVFRSYLKMKNIKAIPESGKIRNLTDQNFKNQGREDSLGPCFLRIWAFTGNP